MELSLEGWGIGAAAEAEWVPWGSSGDARAKVVAQADGYVVAIVEAEAGYSGDPHVHAHAEFLHVLSGTLHTQGRTMVEGDSYVAAPGSTHDDFGTDDGATYVSIFKL